MAHFHPPPIMNMFAPRPMLEFKPPMDKQPCPPYTGIAEYVAKLKDNKLPEPVVNLTKAQQKEKTKRKHEKRLAERRRRQIEKYRAVESKLPSEKRTKDAYKTLFVSRLSYTVTADDLKAEFEYYGPVSNVALVKDKLERSRGYAFVEFANSKDLTEAYKDADGRKINNRRILVDVERGRTVKNWLPRRLGGGLGSSRDPKPKKDAAAALAAAAPYGGGYQGYSQGYSGGYSGSSGYAGSSSYSRGAPSDRPSGDRPRPGLGYASSSSAYPSSSSRYGDSGAYASAALSSSKWAKGSELDDRDRSDRRRDDKPSSSSSSSRHHSSSSRSRRHSSRSPSRSRSRSRSRRSTSKKESSSSSASALKLEGVKSELGASSGRSGVKDEKDEKKRRKRSRSRSGNRSRSRSREQKSRVDSKR